MHKLDRRRFQSSHTGSTDQIEHSPSQLISSSDREPSAISSSGFEGSEQKTAVGEDPSALASANLTVCFYFFFLLNVLSFFSFFFFVNTEICGNFVINSCAYFLSIYFCPYVFCSLFFDGLSIVVVRSLEWHLAGHIFAYSGGTFSVEWGRGW